MLSHSNPKWMPSLSRDAMFCFTFIVFNSLMEVTSACVEVWSMLFFMEHRVYVTHGAEQMQKWQLAFQAKIWTQQWIIWKYKFLRHPSSGLIRIFIVFCCQLELNHWKFLWYFLADMHLKICCCYDFFFFFFSQHFVSKHYWIFTDEELFFTTR